MSRSRFLSVSGLTSGRARLPGVGNGRDEAGPNLTWGPARDDAEAAAAAPPPDEPAVEGPAAIVVEEDGAAAALAEDSAPPGVKGVASVPARNADCSFLHRALWR